MLAASDKRLGDLQRTRNNWIKKQGGIMKTLADLKRECLGKTLLLKERWGKPENKNRIVIGVKSNSIVLQTEEGKKSYLEMPKASLLEYDGKNIKIYEPGTRALTPEEQRIRSNDPKDPEQDRIDMMSDGSTMFYRRQHYYKQVGYEYLFTSSRTHNGKYLTYAAGVPMIRDDALKGKLSLVYEVLRIDT